MKSTVSVYTDQKIGRGDTVVRTITLSECEKSDRVDGRLMTSVPRLLTGSVRGDFMKRVS